MTRTLHPNTGTVEDAPASEPRKTTDIGATLAGIAALVALPALGRTAWALLTAESAGLGTDLTGTLVGGLLLFALVAAAVTLLCWLAGRCADLLASPRTGGN